VELQVAVRDDMGAALSGVPVLLDGVQVATSDTQGQARALVLGARVARVQVSAECPERYRPAPPRSLPLSAEAKALALDIVCSPRKRTLAVVVRAPGGEGAVVRADGEPLGRVNGEGVLHALVERPAESTLRLTIDTSEHPRVLPQHPVREVLVADRDEIVVFDQTFKRAQPKAARPKPAPKPETTHLPYAIVRSPR
jgi:hypothetical protein